MVVVPSFAPSFEIFFDYVLYAPCLRIFLFPVEPGLPWHALILAKSWKIEKRYETVAGTSPDAWTPPLPVLAPGFF